MRLNPAIIFIFLVAIGCAAFSSNSVFASGSVTNSVSQTNELSPLQIIVTPRKTRVHVGEPFKVSLEVKNVSNTNQQFKVWSCGWSQNWKSSNPVIRFREWNCRANWPMDVHLAPNASFKEELNGKEMDMEFIQTGSTNKVAFRMGFTPTVWGDVRIYNPNNNGWRTNQWWIEDHTRIYWSDEVSININPKWIPNWIPW